MSNDAKPRCRPKGRERGKSPVVKGGRRVRWRARLRVRLDGLCKSSGLGDGGADEGERLPRLEADHDVHARRAQSERPLRIIRALGRFAPTTRRSRKGARRASATAYGGEPTTS